jgi:hypothetical protein
MTTDTIRLESHPQAPTPSSPPPPPFPPYRRSELTLQGLTFFSESEQSTFSFSLYSTTCPTCSSASFSLLDETSTGAFLEGDCTRSPSKTVLTQRTKIEEVPHQQQHHHMSQWSCNCTSWRHESVPASTARRRHVRCCCRGRGCRGDLRGHRGSSTRKHCAVSRGHLPPSQESERLWRWSVQRDA